MVGFVSHGSEAAQASSRVARRRGRMRQALLAAGARQFAKRSVETVSVEELLAEADVSRATFYGLFENKYNVLEELINPVFDHAIAAVEALAEQPADRGLDGILQTYLQLWRTHRDALMLIPTIDPTTFRRFESRHRRLNEAMLGVLVRAESTDLLRNGSARYSRKVIARTAIPLLRVYDGHPAAEALFIDAMRALLVR